MATPEEEMTGAAAAAPSKEDRIRLYDDVVEKAELGNIVLMSVNFDVSTDYDPRSEKNRLLYDIDQEGTDFDEENGRAMVQIASSLTVKNGRKSVINCKTRHLVYYRGLSGCNPGAVDRFVSRVGRFTVYPYFRAIVSQMDWNAQLGLPPLPILKEPVLPRNPKRQGSAEPKTTQLGSSADSASDQ